MIARRARLRSFAWATVSLFALGVSSCGGTADEPLGVDRAATIVCAKGTTTPGIDVSYYQGTIDWSAVKGAGYQFAIIRTSDGSYEDPKFATNWAGAKSAGLIRGVYHFFRPGKDPVAQADLVIGKVGKLAADELPVTADVEADDGVSNATIIANLHTFVDRVQAGTGKKPIIYTGAWFWDPNVNASEFSTTPLWVSHYTTGCPNLPKTWSDWAFFQHSSTGTVAGISGDVDLDRYNGTLADLKAFVAGSSVCAPELCNGLDDDCDGVVDNGEVCEHEALQRDTAAYAPPRTTDVDGDGKADVCGRGILGFWCHRGLGTSWSAKGATLPLSDANGWDAAKYWATLRMGDVDGDGKADVCGRSKDGVSCWPGGADGGFGAEIKGPTLSDASGWGAIEYYSTLRLADVDGDGQDDLCALAAKGLVCWASQGTGFGGEIAGPAWSTKDGYSSAKYYGTLRMGDVDGDGRADACIRGPSGVECWLSDGKGFPSKIAGPALSDASGWGALKYWHSIRLADVDGDGRADLCARSSTSLRCWRSTGHGFDGGTDVDALSDASGWGDPSNYRTLRVGDVDGDGKDDLCLRANAKVLCYRWTGDAAAPFASIDGPAWTDANGWDAPEYFDTIRMGDFDGDGKVDVCGRGATGFRCVPWTASGLGAEVVVDEFTDKGGWNVEPYYPTLQYGGPTKAKIVPGGDAGVGDAAPDAPTSDAGADGGDVVVKAAAEAGCSCSAAGGGSADGTSLGTLGTTALALLGGAFALRRAKRRD
jgi:GH25 family lysozyme M1 (1,4-beta-N-acetylmuramidase)